MIFNPGILQLIAAGFLMIKLKDIKINYCTYLANMHLDKEYIYIQVLATFFLVGHTFCNILL